ncbi:hypothetical protein ACP70R_026753 [Stipagrostis hirtigluma subsp. patula]
MSTAPGLRKKKASAPPPAPAPAPALGRGVYSAAAPALGRGGGSAAGATAFSLGRGGGSAAGATAFSLGRGGGYAAAATRPTTCGFPSSSAGAAAAAAFSPSLFDGSNGGGFTSSSPWFDAAGGDDSSPGSWDNDVRPPNGFMSYFGNQPHNFNLEQGGIHMSSMNRPLATNNDSSPPSEVDVRTEKRILWTVEEDVRVMSSWIEHSTDSTCGADKGGNQYWGEVVESYNKTTPPLRRRNLKQCKDRWHKINRWTDLFECAYVKARRVFTSGYSDQMWIDAAHKFYVEDNKDAGLGPFLQMEVWKICREVSKWKTYNEQLRNARKRKSFHLEGGSQENEEPYDEMPKRPMGQKAAKRAALDAKDKSPLFIQAIKGEAPTVHYTVNGTQYDMGYYLADGIYPEWAAFVKTVHAPQTVEDKLYALKQEGARKDVECSFGVLQSRFDIIRRPARLWKQADVVNIMQACVILHNMIVEDEKEAIKDVLDLNYNPSATIVLPPEVSTKANPTFAEALRRNSAIKARPTHRKLKKDLIEHIWQRYGNKEKEN